MVATNYDKWSKFAGDLHSDTDSEEEASFPSKYTEKKSPYYVLPAKKYIPGGKQKLCEILEEVPSFYANNAVNPLIPEDYEGQSSPEDERKPWTMEIHPDRKEEFEKKEAEIKAAEKKNAEVGSSGSTTSKKKKYENLKLPPGPDLTSVAKIQDYFGWQYIGSQFLPGYSSAGSGDRYMWRVWFDDCYLENQKDENPGARALLGTRTLGSFVVGCFDTKEKKDCLISRKQIADLVFNRSSGKDAERIENEMKANNAKMAMFEKAGMQMQNLGPK